MSSKVTREVACPFCNNNTNVNIYKSINVTLNEKLSNKLDEENLFSFRCKHCKKKFKALYPFLYNDMENKMMIYFVPNYSGREIDISGTKEIAKLKDVDKRLVTSFNDLKEKIIIKKFFLEDMAIELTKLAVSKVHSKREHKKIRSIHFCKIDNRTNKLIFSIFFDNNKRAVLKPIKFEVYNKALDIVNKLGVDYKKSKNFIMIDSQFAKEILDKYNEK